MTDREESELPATAEKRLNVDETRKTKLRRRRRREGWNLTEVARRCQLTDKSSKAAGTSSMTPVSVTFYFAEN